MQKWSSLRTRRHRQTAFRYFTLSLISCAFIAAAYGDLPLRSPQVKTVQGSQDTNRIRLLSANTSTCVYGNSDLRLSGRFLSVAQANKGQFKLSDQRGNTHILKVNSWAEQSVSVRIPDLELGFYRLGLYLKNDRVPNALSIEICALQKQPTDRTQIPRTPPAPIEPESRLDAHTNPASEEGIITETSERREKQAGSNVGRATPPAKTLNLIGKEEDTQESYYEARQVLVVSPTLKAAETLSNQVRNIQARVKRRTELKSLGWFMSVVEFRPNGAFEAQVESLVALLPDLEIDLNHHYAPLQNPIAQSQSNPKRWAFESLNWSQRHQYCVNQARIGLIDDGVQIQYFANDSKLNQQAFVEAGSKQHSRGHATAIASLIWGNEQHDLPGLLPDTNIVSAAVFSERQIKGETKQIATTERMLKALNWMAGQQVQLINMSLGGPENKLLARAINALAQRSILVVAAADVFASGKPMYPAALDSVVSVSAIDVANRPRKQSVLDAKVDISAPGVDLWLLSETGTPRFQSGSSYATPFVSAAIILGLEIPLGKATKDVSSLDVSNLCLHTL